MGDGPRAEEDRGRGGAGEPGESDSWDAEGEGDRTFSWNTESKRDEPETSFTVYLELQLLDM